MQFNRHRWLAWVQVLCLYSVMALCLPVYAEDFLPADEAFNLTPIIEKGQLVLAFKIAPGYYLYKDRFAIDAEPKQLAQVAIRAPQGHLKHDANLDQDVEIYQQAARIPIFVNSTQQANTSPTDGGQKIELKISYQGCAEAGLCYPPQTKTLFIQLANGAIQNLQDSAGRLWTATSASAIDNSDTPPQIGAQSYSIQGVLKAGLILPIISVFFTAGLLLSLTPCVLPMVPILSAILLGYAKQSTPGAKLQLSRLQAFGLSLAYALGMASIYTLLGVIAGTLGQGLAAYLQTPWVIGAFGLLLVLLALSMFGLYHIQLPAAWQTRLTAASPQPRRGSYFGVFLMGGLSALVVSPCVAAPLAGALVYISQTGDSGLGAIALFTLAMGMSVPLLLTGLSAEALLPRLGPWMDAIKIFFGFVLLAVAWWLVQSVLPDAISLFLLGSLFILLATWVGAFRSLGPAPAFKDYVQKSLGMSVLIIGIAELIGALSGNHNALYPLKPFTASARAGVEKDASTVNTATRALPFQRVSTPQDLHRALLNAHGKVVMLDFYADWCVACKEMEHDTFQSPQVQQRLQSAQLIQVDLTASSSEQQALLKQFGLFGPPATLFFGADGKELEQARVIGYQDPATFLQSLTQAGL